MAFISVGGDPGSNTPGGSVTNQLLDWDGVTLLDQDGTDFIVTT